MAALREKFKKIIRIIPIFVLFTGIAFGISTRESNPKTGQNQSSSQNYRLENSHVSNLNAETEQPKLVCSDLLEKNANNLVFEEYSKVQAVQCMFVGCGGVF